MKLTTGILAMAMMAGGVWAQNPNVINNVQSTMKAVQQKQANDSNAALGAAGVPAQTAKPVPGAPASKPATTTAPKPAPTAAALVKAPVKPASATAPAAKAATKPAVSAKVVAGKPAKKAAARAPKQQAPKDTKPTAAASKPAADAGKSADASKQSKPEDKKWAMNGKRDPFFSPVVQQSGSGCSTGKKCLEIGQINLRGVVKSDGGFIAVVTNNLNKAYFLRENDPVFNGYVVKITGDSVVFQETVQDKLGKTFTREVVKRIFTPAV